jgi:hypothetical protein
MWGDAQAEESEVKLKTQKSVIIYFFEYFYRADLSLCSELSGVPSADGLEENTAVDYPPAENQLGKIPCCHVRTVPED